MSKISEMELDFQYYFDDIHGDIVIAGITFSPSDILKELDPIAYKQEFDSFINSIGVDIYEEC